MSDGYTFVCPFAWPEGLNRADPTQAAAWLSAAGWKVGPRRARTGHGNSIPSPKNGVPYDITDIACELGVTSYEVAIAIRLFAASRAKRQR